MTKTNDALSSRNLEIKKQCYYLEKGYYEMSIIFRADQLSMSIALQTLEYLQNEEEYIPWQTASSELSYIDMMLSETNIYGLFQVILQFFSLYIVVCTWCIAKSGRMISTRLYQSLYYLPGLTMSP